MSDERELAATRAQETARRTDYVEFVDDAHVHWRVTEREARSDPGAHGDRCLIFTCEDAVRRVWDYPQGWRVLPAEALVALSWRR